MMPTGLLLNIDVPDLEAGIAFYRDGLGFNFRRHLFEHSAAELERDGMHLYLLKEPEGSRAVPGHDEVKRNFTAEHWTPVHFDLLVNDLKSALKKAEKAGARPSQSPESHPYGKIATLRDPFGHGFCLIEMNEDGYNTVADD